MPTATPNVYDVQPGNRAGCNDYLSTVTCAGGTIIDLYYEDDGSGRQQWHFIPQTALVLVPGTYSIQGVGTAAENNPACGTFLGYNACGSGTNILSISNASAAAIAWDVQLVSGTTYTVRADTREACDPNTYLGASPCQHWLQSGCLGAC